MICKNNSAGSRYGLRPPKPQPEPKRPKSNAQKCAEFRMRLIDDPDRHQQWKEQKMLGTQIWYANRSVEQKEKDRISAKLRQQKRR